MLTNGLKIQLMNTINTNNICEDCNYPISLCDCQDNPRWDKIRLGISKRYPNYDK